MKFILEIIIVYIVGIMSIMLKCIIDKRKIFKLITMVSYAEKYVDGFTFKNKEVKLKLVTENLTPKQFDCSYNSIQSHTLYINGNPVVSAWVINTLSKNIKIIYNEKYDTTDLYKILKAYKKQYNKAFTKDFNIEYEKKTMY